MLYAKDYEHLTASDWAGIASRVLKLQPGEQIVAAVSDEHEGGVTSCMKEAKAAIDGFTRNARILLLNGDDFEYESPQEFMKRLPGIRARFPDGGAPLKEAMQAEAEKVLHEKVRNDIAILTDMIHANPGRKIIKVIGNHENFVTFRDALTQLEKTYPDHFQWAPEMAIIPMPGGEKDTRDRLLAVHGDLQMDDLWFVEGSGGTDRERKCLSHREMAEKVVSIATKTWAPSAQKQEKGQRFVNWWRKPNATAKTLFAELLFRAQEGDFYQAVKKTEIDREVLYAAERKLEKRKKKFERMREKLEERTDLDPLAKQAEMEEYTQFIATVSERLRSVTSRLAILDQKSAALPHPAIKSDRKVLYYSKVGEHEPKLFTSKMLERVTHINYGHTHVSAEGVKVKGIDKKKEVLVSNNASVTGAIMRRAHAGKGGNEPLLGPQETIEAIEAGENADPRPVDLGNLGLMLYRVNEQGKINGMCTLGRLITENVNVIRQMIRDIPKPVKPRVEAPAGFMPGAIAPRTIIDHRNDASGGHPGPS